MLDGVAVNHSTVKDRFTDVECRSSDPVLGERKEATAMASSLLR